MATVTKYTFTQQIDYPDTLVSNIQGSSISIPLLNIETSGSGSSMEISLFFTDVLSDADQNTLNTIMMSYVNSLPPLQVALLQVNKNIAFGMSIIAEFSALNSLANLNTADITQLSEQLAPIQALLLAGSIETALVATQGLTSNALLSQDVINSYSQKLQDYLNSNS